MSKDKVGLTIYVERRRILTRENVMKRGSDRAIECTTRSGADDKKKNIAQVAVKRWRPVVKYTANATSPTFIPKSMAFRRRAALTRLASKRPVAAKNNEYSGAKWVIGLPPIENPLPDSRFFAPSM